VIVSSTAAPPLRGARLPRQERRAQLLESALEVFVAQGYHSAAMDDIADRAGVSKPVLYQHFPSKLDLYVALLEAGRDRLISLVREALLSTTDNKLRVYAATDAYFAFVEESAGAFRLVFESDLTNVKQVRDLIDSANAEIALLISEVIAEDTGLSQPEAMLLGTGLAGAAQTAARHWLHEPGQLTRGDAAALVARLQWRGISGVPRHP
jgi:AcrR family transcriptional regulator